MPKPKLTHLTKERVANWNTGDLESRKLAFTMISAAWKRGMITPQPLWVDGKIQLSESQEPQKPDTAIPP